jgi:hypothetical protein
MWCLFQNVHDDTCSNFDFSDKCNLNRQNGSKFICMPVRFNSFKVTALVDSGSSINIMSDQLQPFEKYPYYQNLVIS